MNTETKTNPAQQQTGSRRPAAHAKTLQFPRPRISWRPDHNPPARTGRISRSRNAKPTDLEYQTRRGNILESFLRWAAPEAYRTAQYELRDMRSALMRGEFDADEAA